MSPALRSRRRPRKVSFTLWRLHWTLRREAALRILLGLSPHAEQQQRHREWIAHYDSCKLGRYVARWLAHHPDRRYFPH